MPFNVNNNTVVTDDRIVQSVSGAVGSRPSTPTVGMTFFNTTDSIMEVYNGTAWISTTVGGTVIPTAWSWGTNAFGALGTNAPIGSTSSPVSVVGGFTDWTMISAMQSHTVGLRANGTLYAWGANFNGHLGDNTVIARSSPVSVLGGFTDWVSVASGRGNNHTLAIRANGTLWAWGDGGQGCLGNNVGGVGAQRSSPVSVLGGFTDWVSAGAGQFHSIGLRATGQLYAWGYNGSGRLGDNTVIPKSSPVLVVGGIVDWISASASPFNLGLRANGQLYAWGPNGSGRLGDNSTTAKSSPVLVVGGIVDWAQTSAATYHGLGIRATGQLYAWGDNFRGQLGDNTNTTESKSSPVLVAGGFTDWVSCHGGAVNSLGLRANGTLYSWGSNNVLQLGDSGSESVSKSSPGLVAGGFTDWISISGSAAPVGIRAG